MENTGLLKIGCSRFVYGYGTLRELPAEILRYGKRALVVGGKTTLPLVLGEVGAKLERQGVEIVPYTFAAPNSLQLAAQLARLAAGERCQVVVAVGGGKCMDLCKVVSDESGLPLVTVPTSIATCAASSAVSILYTPDTGAYDRSVPKQREVDSVVADFEVIAAAPRRLLAAGILDSMAKLPEIINGPRSLSYPGATLQQYMAYLNSTAIYDVLTRFGVRVYDNPTGERRLFADIALTNLLITSLVSGFSSGSDQLALAHGLYDGARKHFPLESRRALHGEIVAVGLLIQMRFNKTPEADAAAVTSMMRHMGMPLSLVELGIEPNAQNIQLLKDYTIMKNNITAPADLQNFEQAFSAIL